MGAVLGEGARGFAGTGSLLSAIIGASASPKLPVRGRFLGDSGVSLARRGPAPESFGRNLEGGGGGGGRGGGVTLVLGGWDGSCRGRGAGGCLAATSAEVGVGGVAGRVGGGVMGRRAGGGGVIARPPKVLTCKLACVLDLVTVFPEGAGGMLKGDKAPRVGATVPRVLVDNTAVNGRSVRVRGEERLAGASCVPLARIPGDTTIVGGRLKDLCTGDPNAAGASWLPCWSSNTVKAFLNVCWRSVRSVFCASAVRAGT